jgi:hypothetical protein
MWQWYRKRLILVKVREALLWPMRPTAFSVRFEASTCRLRGGQSVPRTKFSLSILVFPLRHYSTSAPNIFHSSTTYAVCVRACVRYNVSKEHREINTPLSWWGLYYVCLRCLVAIMLPRRRGFNIRSFCVGFMVDKVTLDFSKIFHFPMSL